MSGTLFSDTLIDALRQFERTGSPRPWQLIFDTAPARDFATGERLAVSAPVHSSLRIIDAENRLLVRIGADPEQALKAEDMRLIVEAINAL